MNDILSIFSKISRFILRWFPNFWQEFVFLLFVNTQLTWTIRSNLKYYSAAGVDVMVTNTYQASIEGFKKYLGLNEIESFELIKTAVDQCREAIEIEKQQKTST